MKKQLQLTFLFLFLVQLGWSQSIFTFGGENRLWSNAANWSLGLPTNASGSYAQLNGNASLDISTTVPQLRSGGSTLNGDGGTLTLSGDGVPAVLIATAADNTFTINAPIIIESSATEFIQINTPGGSILFTENSILTTNNTILINGLNGPIALNGALQGNGNIQLRGNISFGSTANNIIYNGDFVFTGTAADVTVDVAEGNVFVPQGRKIQSNNNGSFVTVNTPSVYFGNIVASAANGITVNFNANQESMGFVSFADGTINIGIGNDVSLLSFSDNSGVTWGNGTLVFNNWKNGVVRFGTSLSGLTPTQLTQINIGGGTPALNGNGFLIDPSLNSAPVSTMTNLNLSTGFSQADIDLSNYFSDPQNDVITYQVSGGDNVVSLALSGTTLSAIELGGGSTTVTVVATDEFGAQTQITFTLSVLNDQDGDGVADETDNCIAVPNADQSDSDADGIGNACDICEGSDDTMDADQDGVPDGCDICSGSDDSVDSDSDGIPDGCDVCANTPSAEIGGINASGCGVSERDTDGDGINDNLDSCVNTPSAEISGVDSSGCGPSEVDTDGDGLYDNVDTCDNTPASEIGNINSSGCGPSERDTDGDGINDNVDACINTPSSEVAGVNASGCGVSERDTDGDGLNDNVDTCANTPSSEISGINNAGCGISERDTDGDGVNDNVDACLNTPTSEAAGVNAAGCGISERDTDGDGVNDNLDQCAGTPSGSVVDATGCVILGTKFDSNEVEIYPNPVSSVMTLRNLQDWVGGTVTIHDMSGKRVIRTNINSGQSELIIDSIKPGRYILNVQKGAINQSLSFLKR